MPSPLITFRRSLPYLYAPDGWDAAWRAAKAKAASQRVAVSFIGDSITQGTAASDIMSTSWPALLRAQLLGSGPLGGDYYGLLYCGASGTNMQTQPMATPPVTLSGVSGTDWSCLMAAYNAGAFSGATSKTPLISCHPPYNVTGFDIIYLDYTAGTWTYNVDGGSNTTVTCSNSGGATAFIKKVSITGLASGSHTVNVNSTGTTNTCVILGFVCYTNASNGLLFANHGWGGQSLAAVDPPTTSDNTLSTTKTWPVDRVAVHQGYQGTTASPSALSGFGFPAQPDLAIVSFGVNDVNNSVTTSQFEDGLRRIVQSLRYGKQDACSILLCGMYMGEAALASSTVVASSDVTGGPSVNTSIQYLYDVMKLVAQEYNCAYAAVHALLGRTPVTNGWVTSATNIHPTDAGHAKIANLLGAIL